MSNLSASLPRVEKDDDAFSVSRRCEGEDCQGVTTGRCPAHQRQLRHCQAGKQRGHVRVCDRPGLPGNVG